MILLFKKNFFCPLLLQTCEFKLRSCQSCCYREIISTFWPIGMQNSAAAPCRTTAVYPCTVFSGVFGCKRGKLQWTDWTALPRAAGAAPGSRHDPLHRVSFPMCAVRSHRAGDRPRCRSLRQVQLWRHFPLLQHDKSHGLRDWAGLQIPHRYKDHTVTHTRTCPEEPVH